MGCSSIIIEFILKSYKYARIEYRLLLLPRVTVNLKIINLISWSIHMSGFVSVSIEGLWHSLGNLAGKTLPDCGYYNPLPLQPGWNGKLKKNKKQGCSFMKLHSAWGRHILVLWMPDFSFFRPALQITQGTCQDFAGLRSETGSDPWSCFCYNFQFPGLSSSWNFCYFGFQKAMKDCLPLIL